MDLRRNPFEIDVYGVFDEAGLKVLCRDEPAEPDPELELLVRETWQRQLEASRENGVHLFNGKLVRYLRHAIRGGALHIEAGSTDYAHFLATNYLNWHRMDTLGRHRCSNPLGTSATILTCDGWIVLGRRNERVACHAGYVHNVGGGLEASDRRANGTVDAFASIRRELHEEAGINAADIIELVCLGLIRDPYIHQPELIFDATLQLGRDDVADRIHASDQEHAGVEFCADMPEAIAKFLQTTAKIAPISVGSLCLHGRRHFGDAWFTETFRQLPPPAPPD